MTTIDALTLSELFEDLDADRATAIAAAGRHFRHRSGDVIFREGQPASDLYALGEGRVALDINVQVTPDRPDVPTTVDIAGPTDCFGWSALVEPYVYTATARCVESCAGFVVDGAELRKLMRDDPRLGYEVMSKLARCVAGRLDQTRARLITQIARFSNRDDW